jgi:hypothetical protein
VSEDYSELEFKSNNTTNEPISADNHKKRQDEKKNLLKLNPN